jgi:hypothetical protein
VRFEWLKHPPAGELRRSTAVTAVCLAAAIACQAGADGPSEDPDAATGFTAGAPGVPDSGPATPDPAAAPEYPAMRAELEARGGTDVIGTVALTPVPEGTRISVEIHGANSGLPYVAEIVEGTCAGSGPVIARLGEITAGEEGDGDFQRVVDRALLGPERPQRAVRVRGAGDASAVVACGDLGPGATSATGR